MVVTYCLMRTSASPLLPLLRSEVQGELLALLLLHPDESWSVTGLSNVIRRPVQSVQREVARLASAGIVSEQRTGNIKYVSANTDTPLFGPLAELMAVTYGPEPVLRGLIGTIPDVEAAYIYGSWAARRAGEPGPVPVDVDVVVIGAVPLSTLDDIAEQAEASLHRHVHIRRISHDDWDAAATPFIREIKSRPLIALRDAA